MLKVASDGSCLKNPGGAMGWAWADEKGRWQANGYYTGSNQQAELMGLLSIFKAFPDRDLTIILDSKYALNIAETWMYGWKRNNWHRDKQQTKPVSNLKMVKEIYECMIDRKSKNLKTTFEWVKGHTNHPLNHVADVRAQEAAKKAKNSTPSYKDSAGNTSSKKQEMLKEKTGLV